MPLPPTAPLFSSFHCSSALDSFPFLVTLVSLLLFPFPPDSTHSLIFFISPLKSPLPPLSFLLSLPPCHHWHIIYEVLKMFHRELLCCVTKVTSMWSSITEIMCDWLVGKKEWKSFRCAAFYSLDSSVWSDLIRIDFLFINDWYCCRPAQGSHHTAATHTHTFTNTPHESHSAVYYCIVLDCMWAKINVLAHFLLFIIRQMNKKGRRE